MVTPVLTVASGVTVSVASFGPFPAVAAPFSSITSVPVTSWLIVISRFGLKSFFIVWFTHLLFIVHIAVKGRPLSSSVVMAVMVMIGVGSPTDPISSALSVISVIGSVKGRGRSLINPISCSWLVTVVVKAFVRGGRPMTDPISYASFITAAIGSVMRGGRTLANSVASIKFTTAIKTVMRGG